MKGRRKEEFIMPDMIFKRFAQIDCVEAIALGGSRAGRVYDEKSDYDVYVYCRESIGFPSQAAEGKYHQTEHGSASLCNARL